MTTVAVAITKAVVEYPSDWRAWWAEKSLLRKLAPAILVGLYWFLLHALHGLRGDHLTSGVLILVLTYGGRHLEKLFRFLFPLLLTGIVYDSQRFYSDLIRADYIHIKEPYLFDKFFFGINTAAGRLTPNEWCQLHTHPIIDIVTGFAYIVYVPQYTLLAAFFYFGWRKNKLSSHLDEKIYEMAPRLMWAFFWLNVIGYTTYYWFPAAPPWYVSLYGLGPARLDIPPNMAGCVRFDLALGTHIFTQWYGRSADVFGAVPSLHIAYPLLGAYYAFQFKRLRAFAVGFYLLMCFSAVYLNHHYLLDIIWGSVYAVLTGLTIDAIVRKKISIAGWQPFRAR